MSAPVIWGVVGGAAVAASPLGSWWLPSATVYPCGLILIAAVDIGFSVADGHPNVIVVEAAVATTFVLRAPMAVTGPVWLIVAGLTAHGTKDLWQHRTRYLAHTRWSPRFCATQTGSPPPLWLPR